MMYLALFKSSTRSKTSTFGFHLGQGKWTFELDRQLTLINNQLRSTIDLDKQSTWINNQIGPTINTSLGSTIDLN